MLCGFRALPRLASRASYHSLQRVTKDLERAPRTQQLIFPGWDHLVLANIHTLKPTQGQEAREVHDYDWYSEQLMKHGHIILKNTGIKEPRDFKQWEPLFMKSLNEYEGGISNRDDIGYGVLNVNTFEPQEIDILPHNEMAYKNAFPERIAFCCFTQSEFPGITMLYDNRKISKFMPSHLKKKLTTLGFRINNVIQNQEALKEGKEPFWYNTWQESFGVEDKESLVKVLERDGYQYEFGENDRVKTSKRFEAVHYHEGELYFVHSLIGNHTSYFQFIPYLKSFSLKQRPFYVTWGNGEEFTDEEFNQLIEHESKYQIAVNYEEGDIFFMDNIKFKHGRTPFQGTRKVGVMIGNTVARKTSP